MPIFQEYRGFKTLIRFSKEDSLYYGKIENINDLVSFHGKSIEKCIDSFRKSVNEYLDFCKELNKKIEFKEDV